MRFVVTGGAGFVGSHLVKLLVRKGHQVKVIDNLHTGKIRNLEEVIDIIEFCKIDIQDFDSMQKEELKKSINQVKYFYIFHSLASSHSIYNHNAFKHYDYILSASPQHCKEIRYLEKLYSVYDFYYTNRII